MTTVQKVVNSTPRYSGPCTIACMATAMTVHLCFGYAELGGTSPSGKGNDPKMYWVAAALSFAGLCYETLIRIAMCALGLRESGPSGTRRYLSTSATRERLRLSSRMCVAFILGTAGNVCMAVDIQFVHNSWLAQQYGGELSVQGMRYALWTCWMPIIFSVASVTPAVADGRADSAAATSSLLSGLSCILWWQVLVVPNWWAALACVAVASLSYFCAATEQLACAKQLLSLDGAGQLRGWYLRYMVGATGLYRGLHLLPALGWLSASTANRLYFLLDASFSLGCSTTVFTAYGMALNQSLAYQADTAADDLRRFIRAAGLPIFSVDTQGLLDQWNVKAEEALLLPAKALLGRPLADLLQGKEREEFQARLECLLSGASLSPFQATLRRPCPLSGRRGDGDGRQGAPMLAMGTLAKSDKAWARAGATADTGAGAMTMVLSSFPRRNSAGGICGVTFVGCEWAVLQARALQSFQPQKDCLLGMVSHKLRSPLHGILAVAEHFAQGASSCEQTRLLQAMGGCASQLLDSVGSLMDMNSLLQRESEGLPDTLLLHLGPVELPQVMKDIVFLVKSAVTKSGAPLLSPQVKLSTELKGVTRIEADDYWLRQALLGLLSNACKFTPKGQILLSCCSDKAARWMELAVTDTGCGIPEKDLERIFRPFEQVNMSCSFAGGIGLGLAIAHKVVELHGGHLTVQSEIDQGSRFTIHLPTVWAEHSGEDRNASARPLVLSVEDDELNQMVIESLLEQDYEVHTVMDGQSALEYLQACGATALPDCVLLDVMMPELSGFEVCMKIRNELKMSEDELPVLLLTANPCSAALSKELDCGCNDCILKPFKNSILKAHVAKAVARSRGARQVATAQ